MPNGSLSPLRQPLVALSHLSPPPRGRRREDAGPARLPGVGGSPLRILPPRGGAWGCVPVWGRGGGRPAQRQALVVTWEIFGSLGPLPPAPSNPYSTPGGGGGRMTSASLGGGADGAAPAEPLQLAVKPQARHPWLKGAPLSGQGAGMARGPFPASTPGPPSLPLPSPRGYPVPQRLPVLLPHPALGGVSLARNECASPRVWTKERLHCGGRAGAKASVELSGGSLRRAGSRRGARVGWGVGGLGHHLLLPPTAAAADLDLGQLDVAQDVGVCRGGEEESPLLCGEGDAASPSPDRKDPRPAPAALPQDPRPAPGGRPAGLGRQGSAPSHPPAGSRPRAWRR